VVVKVIDWLLIPALWPLLIPLSKRAFIFARVIGPIISSACVLVPTFALASFDTNLGYGRSGSAVLVLQQFLISQGDLTSDDASGHFGRDTLAGLKVFQSQQGISPVTGFFGPITRAKANTLLGRKSSSGHSARTSSQSITFTTTPTSGQAPLTVHFSYIPGTLSPNVGYMINFGDGTNDINPAVYPSPSSCDFNSRPVRCQSSHTYRASGTYSVQLLESSFAGVDYGVVGTSTITVTGTTPAANPPLPQH
jgi:PKD repeat protein